MVIWVEKIKQTEDTFKMLTDNSLNEHKVSSCWVREYIWLHAVGIRVMAKKSPASKEQLVKSPRGDKIHHIQRALKENVVSVPSEAQSTVEFERITFG